jgi:hypothetical protein
LDQTHEIDQRDFHNGIVTKSIAALTIESDHSRKVIKQQQRINDRTIGGMETVYQKGCAGDIIAFQSAIRADTEPDKSDGKFSRCSLFLLNGIKRISIYTTSLGLNCWITLYSWIKQYY